MRTIKVKWLFLAWANIILLLLGGFLCEKLPITVALLIWLDMVFYSLERPGERVVFFAFLVAFFVFLIGREALCQFGFYQEDKEFSEADNIFAEIVLCVSLFVLGISYILFSRRNRRKVNVAMPINYDSKWYVTVRMVSKYIFFGTFIFHLYQILEIALFVRRFGYADYYVSYSTSVPFLVRQIGDMSTISFWVFLATMPSKKESRVAIMLYLVSLVISLGTGQRFPFVCGILILFVYFVVRNTVNNKGQTWLGKWAVIAVVIAVPFLLMAMVLFNAARFSSASPIEHLFDGITMFFYQQGVSLKEVKRIRIYGAVLPKDRLYSLGSLTYYLYENPIARLLGATYYSGNTVENALYGSSLAHVLSYYVLGNSYLNGLGVGSCYIAEVLYDFGWIGVIFVNGLYGALLAKLSTFKNSGIWKSALFLILLDPVLYAPRGSADGFIKAFLDPTLWVTVLVICSVSHLVMTKCGCIKYRPDMCNERL